MLMRRTPRPSSPLSSLKNIVTNPRKKRFPIHHQTLARNPPPDTQPKRSPPAPTHEKGAVPFLKGLIRGRRHWHCCTPRIVICRPEFIAKSGA
jgi:hypothetical protein